MSQNQPHDNRDAVITTLEQSDRAGDRELAAFMRLETTPRGAA
jgi:predicted FMN-binding regulatory protein PaiB